MNSYSVDSGEAMKRGDEALNASSLQVLRSVKRFNASSLHFFYSALNASSPLFKKKIIVLRFIAVTFLRNFAHLCFLHIPHKYK
jgi:hypothetical protein